MPQQSEPPVSPRHAAVGPSARYVAGGMIVLMLSVLVSRLALAPVHGVRNAAACKEAYTNARSRTDSMFTALLSYPDPHGHGISRRCGELNSSPSTRTAVSALR